MADVKAWPLIPLTGGAVPTIAVVIAIVGIVLPTFWAPLGFDEALNLEIVRNLVHGHGYGTDPLLPATSPTLFDYRVSTGPTLMVPIAAVTSMLGTHVWVYRIVPTLFFLLLLWSWWQVGRRTFDSVVAAAAVSGVLMVNGIGLAANWPWPGSALGESASAACLMCALLVMRHPARCGVLVGLAIMAKVLMVLALPGVALALLVALRRDGRPLVAAFARWGVGFSAPIAIWQVVRIATVGWTRNLDTDGDFLQFLRQDGSGHLDVRTHVIAQLMTLGTAGTAALLLSIGLMVVHHGRPSAALRCLRGLDPCLVGAAVSGVVLESWWLVSESQGWARHSLQATELLLPMILMMAVLGLRRLRMHAVRIATASVLVVLIVAQLSRAIDHAWSPAGATLADQRRVAGLVAEHTSEYRFLRIDHSELRLLQPSLNARPLDGRGGFLVLNLDYPGESSDACDDILVRDAGYVLCRVLPAR